MAKVKLKNANIQQSDINRNEGCAKPIDGRKTCHCRRRIADLDLGLNGVRWLGAGTHGSPSSISFRFETA